MNILQIEITAAERKPKRIVNHWRLRMQHNFRSEILFKHVQVINSVE